MSGLRYSIFEAQLGGVLDLCSLGGIVPGVKRSPHVSKPLGRAIGEVENGSVFLFEVTGRLVRRLMRWRVVGRSLIGDWFMADSGSRDSLAPQVVDVQQQHRRQCVSAAELYAPLQQTVLSHLEGKEGSGQKLRIVGHRIAGVSQGVKHFDHFSDKVILMADIPRAMRTLQVPIDRQILIEPDPRLVKLVEEHQPTVGCKIPELLIKDPESLQDVHQYGHSLLHGYFVLLEEGVLLLLDEVGQLRARRAQLQFHSTGAVVHADHVLVVHPAEHVGVQLVLLIRDVREHCGVPDVGASIADVEVELSLAVDQLQFLALGSDGGVVLAHWKWNNQEYVQKYAASEVLHVGESLGIADAFGHLVAVLDMLVHVLHAGVEDVGQAVLAKVLHAENAVGLCVRVLAVQPQRAQLVDGVQVALGLRKRVQEGLRVCSEAGQYCLGVFFVAEDVVEYCLAVVLGYVLGLADVYGHILRILIVRPVRVLLLTLQPLPPPPHFILLPLIIDGLLILGGIFVGVSGAGLTVIL